MQLPLLSWVFLRLSRDFSGEMNGGKAAKFFFSSALLCCNCPPPPHKPSVEKQRNH